MAACAISLAPTERPAQLRDSLTRIQRPSCNGRRRLKWPSADLSRRAGEQSAAGGPIVPAVRPSRITCVCNLKPTVVYWREPFGLIVGLLCTSRKLDSGATVANGALQF